jgi:diguanylate cyclase (GGDEF)-like protein/PAS domain S-box-containing protein
VLNGARYVDLAQAFCEPWVSVAGAAVAIALLVAAIRSSVMTSRLRQRLAVLEQEHRLLAEHSSDIVVLVDAQGRVRWVSPAVRPVLGWSPTEWAGRSFIDFFASGEDGHDVLRQCRQATLREQAIVVRSRMPARNGVDHWVEVHAGPWHAAGQRDDGTVVSLRVVDAEERARQILEQRACTDELTSLFNRREALARMHSLDDRQGGSVAVLWCDVDWFKRVNDTHGHATGDAVLQELADRIRGSLRTSDDLAARMGGDELMVVLYGVRTLEDACAVAEKLRKAAAKPIATAAGPIAVTLSIGVTLAQPSEPADAAIARADTAMYRAKRRGRNQVVALRAGEAIGLEETAAEDRRKSGGPPLADQA